jgi:hypothetical protein
MRRNKFVFVFLVIVFAGFITSLSFAQPPIDRGIRPEPRVTVPDDPQIREFSVNPTSVVQGGQVTFRWRVEPGPGGSPITGVRITVGAIELRRSPSASATQIVTLPASLEPRDSWLFVLTATNGLGISSTRTLNLSIVADTPVVREFSVNPNPIFRGERVTFRWRVEPLGTSPINRIRITRGTTEVHSSTASSGEYTYTYDLSPTGEREEFVLTATNQANRSTRRSVYLQVAHPYQINAGISTEPSELIPGSPYTLIFTITNNSDAILSGIDIKILCSVGGRGGSSEFEEARTLALRGQTINPGRNTYRFSHTLPRGTRILEGFDFWVGRERGGGGRSIILEGEVDAEVVRTINVYRVGTGRLLRR